MSGVMGASFRSMAGSPEWTAIVSGCGIGSAYLKPLEPQDLFRVAKAFQDGQPRLHLPMIAREQRSLAPDASGIGERTHALKQIDRSVQRLDTSIGKTQRAIGLRLDQRQLMGMAVVEDGRDPGRGRHLVLIEQSAQAALEVINAKHLAELKSIDGSGNGRDVLAAISLPEAIVRTLL